MAVLDTGIYPHEGLKDRITGFYDVFRKSQVSYDDNDHKNHVCGIIGGDNCTSDDRFRGVAPGSSLIAMKVLDVPGNCYVSDILTGLKWIRDHRAELGIHIVNISVGSCSRKNIRIFRKLSHINKATSFLVCVLG